MPMKNKMKPTRHYKPADECELWGRAAGRCEFDGCNKIVYKSEVTQERVNISQKAHIYAFSEDGPRGRGPYAEEISGLNGSENLMLLCHPCHKKIDKLKDGGRYDAALLKDWKAAHERRIRVVSGVHRSKNSHVVIYAANIGDGKAAINPQEANGALFPDWYPAQEEPLHLRMSWDGRDDRPDYWKVEDKNLIDMFDRRVLPRIEEGSHFSIFAFAPMPLLIRLGTLFTDRARAEVYQNHREPAQTWRWGSRLKPVAFTLRRPKRISGPPALLLSLSAKIAPERVGQVLGKKWTPWELTIEGPYNDFLKTRAHLSDFRASARAALAAIARAHGDGHQLSVFPAMPVAAAVEFGRVRMPKADAPWRIFDYNQKSGRFTKALDIGGANR